MSAASLPQRLQAMQMATPVEFHDLDHLGRAELAMEIIDFGNKHKGKSFIEAWTEDQDWVSFMVKHYATSTKLSHRKLLKFVDLQLQEHEKHQMPVPVMKSAPPTLPIHTPKSTPKAKAKGYAAPTPGMSRPSHNDLVGFRGRVVRYRDVCPSDYDLRLGSIREHPSHARSHPAHGERSEPSDSAHREPDPELRQEPVSAVLDQDPDSHACMHADVRTLREWIIQITNELEQQVQDVQPIGTKWLLGKFSVVQTHR